MTDFLTRLTERTQGRTAVVQPLVVPWAMPSAQDRTELSPGAAAVLDEAPRTDRLTHEGTVPPVVEQAFLDTFSIDFGAVAATPPALDSPATRRPANEQQPVPDSQPPQRAPAPQVVPDGLEPLVVEQNSASGDQHLLVPHDAAERLSNGFWPTGQQSSHEGPRLDGITPRPGGIGAGTSLERDELTGSSASAFSDIQESAEHLPATIRATASPQREEQFNADSFRRKQPVEFSPPATRLPRTGAMSDNPAAIVAAPLAAPLVPVVARGREGHGESVPEPPAIVDPQHAPPVRATPEPGPVERNSPPVVKVTIGRIEVRAAGPTPGTPNRTPAAPRQPAVSLQDYLKRRNGGIR